MASLLALHGYTQNGAVLRAALAPLLPRLPGDLELLCPDGPVTCSPEGVDRMYATIGGARPPGPYLSWWDASDDGRVYDGWELTLERMRQELERVYAAGVGLLGFSQGAMLATAVAALAARGELPPIRYAIMVAGRAPRAEVMQSLFDQPIAVPSLHVWGERDRHTVSGSQALVGRFAADLARTAIWPGPHAIPTSGSGADAITDFIAQHA